MKVASLSLISFLSSICFLLLVHHCHHVVSFSASRGWLPKHAAKIVLKASFSHDDVPEYDHPNRIAEFRDLEPLAESATRRARIREDKRTRRRFAKHGDELWALRKVIEELSQKLVKAINNDSRGNERSIREQLRQLEEQDPELVYKSELVKMRRAQNEGRDADATEHSRNALAARSQLPQYNLDGKSFKKRSALGKCGVVLTSFDFL